MKPAAEQVNAADNACASQRHAACNPLKELSRVPNVNGFIGGRVSSV